MISSLGLRAPSGRSVARGGPLTGTGALTRLALRRDRVMLPAWVYVGVIGVATNAYTFVKLYKTASSRAALLSSGESNPALLFLYGRLNGDSVGALTEWRHPFVSWCGCASCENIKSWRQLGLNRSRESHVESW